ncbi:polymorphic toxin-type HINT domain-containing protein [Haloactinospora alba]|uniref:polymorphic toxin-type HINT domain-containing protein n=1 Tax=Haloactinospora alba TaxID=405555 RepID=UPI001153C938|nr:polymorphic toxin-type HINT domain-containing protein [Haloactinospora alba]
MSRLRWVWRAESGASLVEYAALVALASALVVALISAGLTTRVGAAVEEGLCLLYGEDGCQIEAGGNDSGDSSEEGSDSQDGDSARDSDDSGGNDSEEGSGGDSEEDGSGGQDSGDGDDSSEGEQVAYDPEKAQEFEDAQEEISEAEDEYESAKQDMDDLLTEDLPQLLGDLIGIEDARKCFMEGDIAGCLWTLVSLVPWTKIGKFISKIPKIVKLGRKWYKLYKAKKTASSKLDNAKKSRNEALVACAAGGEGNSFVGGTPVLTADGSATLIAELEEGDRVLATDPATGETAPRPVTATMSGTGVKETVEVTVLTRDGAETLTATGGHPFWTNGRSWTDAGDLAAGDRLRTPTGERVTVAHTATYRQPQAVYNISVADIPTYYVGAGGDWMLVHNQKKKTKCPSVNQVADKIKKGNAPRGVERLDKGQPETGEQPHIHFDDGSALNLDGSWKGGHPPGNPTKKQRKWLEEIGWGVPD